MSLLVLTTVPSFFPSMFVPIFMPRIFVAHILIFDMFPLPEKGLMMDLVCVGEKP